MTSDHPLRSEHPALAEHPVLEAELEQLGHEARRIAAGGWRRAAIGFGLGVTVGLLAAATVVRPAAVPALEPRRAVAA